MAKRINTQTGPTSADGKSRSSQNSTTHGCRSEQHRILPGEDPAAYEAIRLRWFNEYGGEDENDAALIEVLIQAEWRFKRCERKLAEAEAYINANKPIWEWTDEDHKLITLARRYMNQAWRFYTNARRDVDNLRQNRQIEIKLIVEAERAKDDHVLRHPELAKPQTETQPQLSNQQTDQHKEPNENKQPLPSQRH